MARRWGPKTNRILDWSAQIQASSRPLYGPPDPVEKESAEEIEARLALLGGGRTSDDEVLELARLYGSGNDLSSARISSPAVKRFIRLYQLNIDNPNSFLSKIQQKEIIDWFGRAREVRREGDTSATTNFYELANAVPVQGKIVSQSTINSRIAEVRERAAAELLKDPSEPFYMKPEFYEEQISEIYKESELFKQTPDKTLGGAFQTFLESQTPIIEDFGSSIQQQGEIARYYELVRSRSRGHITDSEFVRARSKLNIPFLSKHVVLSEQTDELNKLTAKKEAKAISEETYDTQSGPLRAVISSLRHSLREEGYAAGNADRILQGMRGQPPASEGLHPLDVFNTPLEDRVPNFLEESGMPPVLTTMVSDAKKYYRIKDNPAQAGQKWQLARNLKQGNLVLDLPDDLDTYIHRLAYAADPAYGPLLREVANTLSISERSAEAIQASIKASTERTNDYFKLLGLGALPDSAAEMSKAMGNPVLHARGIFAGQEATLIQGEGMPLFVDSSNVERNISEPYSTLESGIRQKENSVNIDPNSAVWRSLGFRSGDLSGIEFALHPQEPNGFEPHRIRALELASQRFLVGRSKEVKDAFDESKKTKKDINIGLYKDDMAKLEIDENAIRAVNDKIASTLQGKIYDASTLVSPANDPTGSLEFYKALTQPNRDGSLEDLGIAPEEITPTRAAEETVAGLLYGDADENGRYFDLYNLAVAKETPFAESVQSILEGVSPGIMGLDPSSDSFISQIQKRSGSDFGIVKNNEVREALMYAEISNRNVEDKTKQSILEDTRDYEFGRLRHSVEVDDVSNQEDPSSLDFDIDNAGAGHELIEPDPDSFLDISADASLAERNAAIVYAVDKVETITADAAYDIDTPAAEEIRNRAMELHKLSRSRNGDAKLTEARKKMLRHYGPNFTNDAFEIHAEMQDRVKEARKARIRIINAQHQALFKKLQSKEIPSGLIDHHRNLLATELIQKLTKAKQDSYLEPESPTIMKAFYPPSALNPYVDYFKQLQKAIKPYQSNMSLEEKRLNDLGLRKEIREVPLDFPSAKPIISTSTKLQYEIPSHTAALAWVDKNRAEEIERRARAQMAAEYDESRRNLPRLLSEAYTSSPERLPGNSLSQAFRTIHQDLLDNGQLIHSPSSRPKSGYKANIRDFITSLSEDDKTNELATKLGLGNANDVFALAEKESDRDPFFGRGVLSILSNLEKEKNSGIGPLVDITTPEFEESHRQLFGSTNKLTMRLESLQPLHDIEGGPVVGAVGTFVTPGELSLEERTNQLAAYFLPSTQLEWEDGLKELDMNGRLSLEAREKALEKAREFLSLNKEHKIVSELRPETVTPASQDVTDMISDYLDREVFKDSPPSDIEQATIIDQMHEDLKAYLSRNSALVRLKPSKNSAALDAVQSLAHTTILQSNALPDLSGLGGVGPGNGVTRTRLARNLESLVRQGFKPADMELIGKSNREQASTQVKNASIFNTDFNPLDVDGTRLGSELFGGVESDIDAELRSQFPKLNLDVVKQIDQVFKHAIKIDDGTREETAQITIRDLLGLNDNETYLNSPLARYSRRFTNREASLYEGETLQALFARMVVNSRKTRSDLEKEYPEIVARFDEGTPLEDIMAEIAKVGPDLRPSITRKAIASHIGTRALGMLDPEVRRSLGHAITENQSSRLDEIARHLDPASEGATEAATLLEHTRPDYTRIWNHPIQQFSRMWNSSRLAKAGMVGAAGFVAAGMIDGHIKKDHTKEDMQGPATVPGGSPYQDTPAYGPTVGGGTIQSSLPQSSGGMEYNVRASGNIDPAAFQGSVSALLGTNNISGSSYNYPQSAGANNNNDIYDSYSD